MSTQVCGISLLLALQYHGLAEVPQTDPDTSDDGNEEDFDIFNAGLDYLARQGSHNSVGDPTDGSHSNSDQREIDLSGLHPLEKYREENDMNRRNKNADRRGKNKKRGGKRGKNKKKVGKKRKDEPRLRASPDISSTLAEQAGPKVSILQMEANTICSTTKTTLP